MCGGLALVVKHLHSGSQHWVEDVRSDSEDRRTQAHLRVEDIILTRLVYSGEVEPPAPVTGNCVYLSVVKQYWRAMVNNRVINDIANIEARRRCVVVPSIETTLWIAQNRDLLLPGQIAKLIYVNMAGHRGQTRNGHATQFWHGP